MPQIFDNIELPLLPASRNTLQAVHLTGHPCEVTEDEFTRILGTFPLVDKGVKHAAFSNPP